jgi:hypothetical protein
MAKQDHKEEQKDIDESDKSLYTYIENYEKMVSEALVSNVPLWVMRYYEGIPEIYLKDTGSDDHKK